jgi:hypothetical protein
MGIENDTPKSLVSHREPVGPTKTPVKGSVGTQMLWDSLIIVGIAWAILFFLVITLKSHNI